MNIFKDTGKTQSSLYRPDIDGLRAIAVLLVLFFHAGFDTFSGGYVGVDVFFVISGFLITGILISSIEKNKYSFKTFILSRITRLYPALVSTVIITIALGFLIFTPSDYINLGKTSIYTIASISNFYFWMKSGYFDTSSETNPLLHTWSLSVEQQFYLVWPLILVLAMKFGRKGVLYAILTFGLLSLGFSEAFVKIDPTSNYYLMPFRIFEFAAGGVLALRKSSGTKKTIANDIGFLFGLTLIVFSAITYGKATAFPGVHALVPTLGACLCILFGGQSRASYLVRNTPVVSIGIVSYSIYLVHWPVLVFYKYYIYRPINDFEKISLILVSIALGFASYVFVENRFRKINLASINKMSASLLLSITAICAASFIIIGKSGFEFRVNDYFRERINNAQEMHFQLYGGAGYYFGSYDIGDKKADKPVAVLMGDSFARQYAWSMEKKLKQDGIKIVTAFQDGCWFSATHTTIEGGKPKAQCVEMFNKAIELSNSYNIPIIWGMSWLGNYKVTGSLDGSPITFKDHNDFLAFAGNNVNDLLSKIGSNLLIIGIPTGAAGASGVASCIERPDYLPLSCAEYLTTPTNNSFTWGVNSFFKKMSNSNRRISFIDPNDVLCSNGICSTMTKDNQFIYSDGVHLSRIGTDLVLDEKWNDIKRIF